MPGVSDCLNLKRDKSVFTRALYRRSCSSLITRNAYGEAQGCLRSQQCYRHLLTSYLIFENVLIVYGIILECMDIT